MTEKEVYETHHAWMLSILKQRISSPLVAVLVMNKEKAKVFNFMLLCWANCLQQGSIAFASEVYSNGYFRYTSDDNSVTIISYFGTEETVTVPDIIAGNPVNVIAKKSFSDNKSVKTVRLPETIMTVEEGAFGAAQSVIYYGSTGADSSQGTGSSGAGKISVDLFFFIIRPSVPLPNHFSK